VLFDATVQSREADDVEAEPAGSSADEAPSARRIHALERELAATREHLQTTIEERESTLEELKGANEELQSSNEELQSTNEELETSKEEMQSTNEELTTLNDELHSRMAELSVLNDDLHNVLSGVDNAVVVAGLDLKIRRYTAAAEKLFHLLPGDVGRGIGLLDTFLGSISIEPKVVAVIQNLGTFEEDLLAANQRWYSLKIQPYKTLDHSIRGALVTLVDVDVRRRAQERTRDIGAYASKFLAAIGHPLLILDRKQRVVWANDAFFSMFQLTADETVGSTLATVGTHQFADSALTEQLNRVFESATIFRNFKMRIRVPGRAELAAHVGGSQVPASAESLLALVSIEVSGIDAVEGAV
jgi:two-component system CheB/CheR fusion protein